MNPAARDLRRMARYIRRNGFSPEYQERDDPACGCFAHAAAAVDVGDWGASWNQLTKVIGTYSFFAPGLSAAGWTGPECTADAAAACEIAADIAEASHA